MNRPLTLLALAGARSVIHPVIRGLRGEPPSRFGRAIQRSLRDSTLASPSLAPKGRVCLDGQPYFVSLWSVCLRQRLQNFENSRRPVVVFLFFVVE